MVVCVLSQPASVLEIWRLCYRVFILAHHIVRLVVGASLRFRGPLCVGFNVCLEWGVTGWT